MHEAQGLAVLNNPTLQQDIETMLRDVVKCDVRIVACQPLTYRNSVRVSRLRVVTPSKDVKTVIVKHIPASHYPISHSEPLPPVHSEEQFAYQFLSTVRQNFNRLPQLLAYRPGIFMLEDLGTGTIKEYAQETVMESLATTLATLHTATAPRYLQYQHLRQQAGLDSDRRMYSAQEQNDLFDIGIGLLYKYCNILGIDIAPCQPIFEQVRDEIANPGPFRAFIHDDLAAARQIVIVDDECYLIDFEMAKYGHMLMDICKPLIGKFDRKGKTDYFVLNHLDFPITFATCYRQKLEVIAGLHFPNTVWDQALSSTLIFSTFVNCGALCCVEPPYKPLGSFIGLFKQLLQRLLLLLKDNNSDSLLNPILDDLVTRIIE